MTAIAWTVVDPDTIERIIAVGLCRRHTNARRINPSQGDGGLDVVVPVPSGSQLHVDNYQVKKFADDLNDSRKQQIKKSLTRAIATHNDTEKFDYTIATWYLHCRWSSPASRRGGCSTSRTSSRRRSQSRSSA
ncbi:hypothetical protein [Nocardioides sp.]|uniref:hypothetical protein n=1 Tax=Nocardioides sp. TaxID=35761 RepID=UPI003D1120CD